MTDTYQAIYDGVRSRISNGDVGSAIRDVAAQQFDISFVRQHAQEAVYQVAGEWQRPSVLYRPQISADGDMWCALLGEDLQIGVAGFGKTPAEAMAAFDMEFWKGQTPTAIRLASVGRNAKRQDRNGLGPEDEHAVPHEDAADAQQPSPSR